MTTSGVSKTISRMEKVRGIRLLNRSTHAVSLTPEGERLLPFAQGAIRGMAEVEAIMSVAASSGAGGRVRLGAPTAFLNACLAPLLRRFREAHPQVTLELRGSDMMVDLADEAVDLVLRTGHLKGIPAHLSQVLFEFPWVTCASPDYLARHGQLGAPADLAGHELLGFRNQRTGIVDPWLYREPGCHDGRTLRHLPSPKFILDDANAIVAAATAGAGIAWTPQWLVSSALRNGALVPLLTEWSAEEMAMSLVRREGLIPERVEQVIAFLKANRFLFR